MKRRKYKQFFFQQKVAVYLIKICNIHTIVLLLVMEETTMYEELKKPIFKDRV
jgi:hypothetical protein